MSFVSLYQSSELPPLSFPILPVPKIALVEKEGRQLTHIITQVNLAAC